MDSVPTDTKHLPDYGAADFDLPVDAPQCDMIMKGGITSGIVYPYAILELARKYRLRSIGGASAGAIAAAFAAAAEYARRRGDPDGYVRLQAHCRALPDVMPQLFQADPAHAPLWRLVMAGLSGGWRPALLRHLAPALLVAAGAALLLGVLLVFLGQPLAVAVLAALLVGLVGLLAGLWRATGPVRQTLAALPGTDFGLCSGATQPGQPGGTAGLTDWLHAALQDIAFGKKAAGHAPLTFGDLEWPRKSRAKVPPPDLTIALRMVTTNLSMRRPVNLPFLDESAFDPDEWRRLFPADVVAHLMEHPREAGRWEPAAPLCLMPAAEDLPVIVAVRMSLSFPVLFAAVPVHQPDIGLALLTARLRKGGDGAPAPSGIGANRLPATRMLYSDGGISSNFPVHFFDAPLPGRPTFAISLGDLPQGAPVDGDRVILPGTDAHGGRVAPASPVTSLGQFGWAVLGSAKDWQDQLLAEIPGQRERIATIFLAPDEGGLNLAMPAERSRRLMGYGRAAGVAATTQFSWDEHRWRRTLIFVQAHSQLSDKLVAGHKGIDPAGFTAWYADFALTRRKRSYSAPKTVRQTIGAYVDACAAQAAANLPDGAIDNARLPRARVRYRIRPDV